MKVIQDLELHTEDFEVVGNQVRTKMGKHSYQIRLNNGIATWGSGDTPERRIATVMNNGFGFIHLDYKVTSGSTGSRVIAFLPSECPTPTKLMEAQLWDGRSIWIDGGSREIIISSSVLNTRYLVDFVGFFNTTR